jgi:hypothetical protein
MEGKAAGGFNATGGVTRGGRGGGGVTIRVGGTMLGGVTLAVGCRGGGAEDVGGVRNGGIALGVCAGGGVVDGLRAAAMARAIADHGTSIPAGLDDGGAAPDVVAFGVRVAAGAAPSAFGRTAGGRLSRSGGREIVGAGLALGAGALEGGAAAVRADCACAGPKAAQAKSSANVLTITALRATRILLLPPPTA